MLAWEALRHDFWTAEDGGEVAGFLIAEERQSRGYVTTVDVLPRHRGRGVASRLMQAAEKEYRKRGYRRMRLEVGVDNPAQTLYFKLGYRTLHVRHNYYKKGSHALTMEKAL